MAMEMIRTATVLDFAVAIVSIAHDPIHRDQCLTFLRHDAYVLTTIRTAYAMQWHFE